MPTARELLEQADALMRRNRAGGDSVRGDGAPASPVTLTPAAGATSPRTIQREPIAPSTARTSLPVDPIEPPATPPRAATAVAREAGMPAEVRRPADPNEAEFPLLTDAIDGVAGPDARLEDAPDDVPVLTDAVEEIDVGIVEESARGEPSFWDTVTRGDASVVGPGPDSIAVVPAPSFPAADIPQSPPSDRDPLGLDHPLPGFEPPPATGIEEAPESEAGTVAKRGTDTRSPMEPVPPAAEPGEALVVSDEWSPVPDDVSLADLRATEDAAAQSPVAPPPSEADLARVREIAEEIGMQVLQRIDIFSDTTLPGQLGERLKPVVERASADLVAAINQHVGELLRAYIAEAIAREIESWRHGGR